MTLAELLLVMVILGMLTAVALPACQHYSDRVRSSNAITEIMTMQVMSHQYVSETPE